MSKKRNKPAAPSRVRSTKAADTDKQPEAEAEDEADAEAGDGAEGAADEAEDDQQDDTNAQDGEADADSDTDSAEDNQDPPKDPPANKAPSKAAKAAAGKPAQAGFAKRAGRESTAPAPKTGGPKRPYLDSPRHFGVHIDGLLHRFNKGKTALTEDQADALEADSYVKDNGAEVIR